MKKFIQTPRHYLKRPLHKDYYYWLKNFLKKNKIKSFVDIGCASGYLSYYMPKNIEILGIDISEILLKKARKINKNRNKSFAKIDLLNTTEKNFFKLAKKNNLYNYPLVTLFGTLNIFNDIEKTIKRLSQLKPKKIIISSRLNSNGFNLTIKYKKYLEKKTIITNVPSTDKIIKIFSKHNYKVKLIKYNVKTNIKKDKKDSLRNYHIFLKNGQKILTNGLGILSTEYLIVASKK